MKHQRVAVDLGDPHQRRLAIRLARSWMDLRRGQTADVRAFIYGDERPLETGQMDALDVLVRADRSMSELAGKLRIDRSTATRAVDRLVQDGLAERFADDGDRRMVRVRVTQRGRRRHGSAAERRAELLSAVLGAFDDDEREQLVDYLERFTRTVDEHVRRADPEPERRPSI